MTHAWDSIFIIPIWSIDWTDWKWQPSLSICLGLGSGSVSVCNWVIAAATMMKRVLASREFRARVPQTALSWFSSFHLSRYKLLGFAFWGWGLYLGFCCIEDCYRRFRILGFLECHKFPSFCIHFSARVYFDRKFLWWLGFYRTSWLTTMRVDKFQWFILYLFV